MESLNQVGIPLVKCIKNFLLIISLLTLVCTSQLFIPLIEINLSTGSKITMNEKNLKKINSLDRIDNPTGKGITGWNTTKDFPQNFFSPEDLNSSAITISRSLEELLQPTPKLPWNQEKVQLIVAFKSNQEIPREFFSKYNCEIMEILPIVMVSTPLNTINDIKSVPGVMGVYLDQPISFNENEWDLQSMSEPEGISTYPSESVIGARYLQILGINGSGVKIAILLLSA